MSHAQIEAGTETTPEVEVRRVSGIASRSTSSRLVRKGVHGTILLVLFLLSAEMTARLDDWLHLGVPIFATPDMEQDLLMKDENGTRGRPHGRFKKWQLNAYGFRSPVISLTPSPDCKRIMVLGASETFGLYESEHKEFPAQLAGLLEQQGRCEVINAALPGMSIRSMTRYWETWAGQFRPDVVVIYPSPAFYLNDSFSRAPRPKGQPQAAGHESAPGMRSRLVFRMKDTFHLPDFVEKWRAERDIRAKIDSLTAGEDGTFFRAVPRERVDLFSADLGRLVKSIQKQGARPILLTHAMRSAIPPRAEDLSDLRSARIHLPRVTEEVFAEFEQAAARAVVERAGECGVRVVDIAGAIGGRREWFADLVHFNDEGASVVGELVAEGVRAEWGAASPDRAGGQVSSRSVAANDMK
jgi:hypothetical protein